MKRPPEIEEREETPSLRDKRLLPQKPFGIESRLTRSFLIRIASGMAGRTFVNDWRLLRWYEKEEVRDRALEQMNRKGDTCEYRACHR
jgi:hypothetical protein